MSAVTLLQTGVIKRLPDIPASNFDSNKVNSSDIAYALGVPDGALSLAGFAVNIPLAAWGGSRRSERQPLIPVVAATKALVEAAAAGWYFYQMPTKEKKWCIYCIAGAALTFGVAALALPEAVRAIRTWKRR